MINIIIILLVNWCHKKEKNKYEDFSVKWDNFYLVKHTNNSLEISSAKENFFVFLRPSLIYNASLRSTFVVILYRRYLDKNHHGSQQDEDQDNHPSPSSLHTLTKILLEERILLISVWVTLTSSPSREQKIIQDTYKNFGRPKNSNDEDDSALERKKWDSYESKKLRFLFLHPVINIVTPSFSC